MPIEKNLFSACFYCRIAIRLIFLAHQYHQKHHLQKVLLVEKVFAPIVQLIFHN